MTSTSPKIIFFGTEDFSLIALTRLIEAGFDIAAVVTKPDSKKGRGQKLTPPAVKLLAEKHQIPVWQPNRLRDITDEIKALGTPPLGVLVSYGKIIPQSTLDLFKPGIINVHPSLLPKYRGPSPIEAAIKNGDQEAGVSIMHLSAEMDAGPVYVQQTVSLNGTETRPELYNKLGSLGAELLVANLPAIASGQLAPNPQDDSKASYCQILTKTDAWLEPAQLSAAAAERRIRAHLGFPKTKLTLLGQDVIITKASLTDQPKTPLDLRCRDGAFLSIEELVAPTGRTMSAAAFLRGYSR